MRIEWVAAVRVAGVVVALLLGAPARADDDRSCTTNEECVVSCDDDCCPNCGCTNALNREAAAHYQSTRSKRCTRDVVRKCPDLACALDMSLKVPVCSEGRCMLLGHRESTYPLPTTFRPPPPDVERPPAPVKPSPSKVAPLENKPDVPAEPKRTLFPTPMPTSMPPFPAPKSDVPKELRCESSADCELSCEGCCGAPCGCGNAVNHAAAKEARRTKAARCKGFSKSKCPAVGCAKESYAATCDAGRCRAVKGFGGLLGETTSTTPANGPSGTTTLEGVRIEFPVQRTTFTLAQLRRGVALRWNLVVEKGPGGLLVPDRTPNNCGTPGRTGFVTHAVIQGVGSQRYCLCDTGLCAPSGGPTTLQAGRDAGSLRWDGSTWEGPSDTNQPRGRPFTPGLATLEVTSSGTYEGQPFRVVARLPVTITP